MRFGNREFRPRLWPTVATIILLPILLRLGFWQLDRAEEKRQIQQQFEQQQARPAVRLNQLNTAEDNEFRHARVTGRFDTQHQILLDNQVHDKQVGYQVLTPLHYTDSDKYILVNRGWIKGSLRRNELPEIPSPQETITLQGRLKHPGKLGIELAEHSYSKIAWPLVVEWVDVGELESVLGYKLNPYVLQLNKEQPYGFVREWKIINTQPERSTSYAVQWFSLAFALVVIFIVVNSRKIDNAEHKH